jgi:lysophospholipase L1-like esterase
MQKRDQVHLAILLYLLLAGSSEARTLTIDKNNKTITSDMLALTLHVGGRVEEQANPSPLAGKTYTHQWPGVYFEANFNGDTVFLKFADPYNEYRAFVDEGRAIELQQLGAAEVVIADLGMGKHHLRVEKVTESIEVTGRFQGVFVRELKNVEAVHPRKRMIEFIGDSNMTGYGLRSKTRTCSQNEIRLLSDTQVSYPALVAKHFDADYQVNAVSGRGMVRNYDGFDPDIVMPLIYPFALLDKSSRYHNAEWKPQITFIALGANDFATDLHAGEPWTSDAALFASYIVEFKKFLVEIYTRSPGTSLVISWTDMMSYMADADKELVIQGQKTISKAAKEMGFKSVDFIPMSDLGLSAGACDSHATAADHQKLKNWLITYLNTKQELWQKR